MRLMRVGPCGNERPVVLDENGIAYDLSDLTADIDGSFLAAEGVKRVREALASNRLNKTGISGQRIGAPIARPSVVLCIGMNYAAHAAESGNRAPEIPIIFYKAPNTVVGPNDTVLIPRGSRKTDWEIELGVVLGTRARYLDSPKNALDYVAGYVLSNDVSERYFQMEASGGQWSKGKSCETFNPLGPWLVTADEIPDPQAIDLRLAVNGETRQDSSTGDMVFGVAELIYQLSQVTVLEPGDLINTGTPQGVAFSGRFPYLAAGDRITLTTMELGRQEQTVALG